MYKIRRHFDLWHEDCLRNISHCLEHRLAIRDYEACIVQDRMTNSVLKNESHVLLSANYFLGLLYI
jgi:CRISPR/Cas system CMR-associated protein Cmr1 (group 7 of RAMP superfamily)